MKRLLLFVLVLGIVLPGLAQRAYAPKELRDQAVQKEQVVLETNNFSNEVAPANVNTGDQILDEIERNR